MIAVPKQFQPHINTDYPQNNKIIFEEWFAQQHIPDTEREYLPIFWTSYYVCNNYGNNKKALYDLQQFIDSLDKSKKYYTIIQYDDSILNDVTGLDILRFEMSKSTGYPLPLLCMPHPYKHNVKRDLFANFIGNRTHPIRDFAKILPKDYYVAFNNHPTDKFTQIINRSIFTLCFRGYGINSFRIAEAVQYGSIPVYISDDFVFGHHMDFESFGVVIKQEDVQRIDEILKSIPLHDIIKKQDLLPEIYQKYFTYQSNYELILKAVQDET